MKDLIKNLQLGLLVVILISTVIAVFLEISNMYQLKDITLADLLLMFLYLEVLAMVEFLGTTINQHHFTIINCNNSFI